MAAETPSPLQPDRVAVVVNGNAKQVTDDLVEMLDQIVQSGDLFVSRSLDEGHDIALRIVERGYPVVLTGGGDGTFVRMVTWITREAKARGREPPRFGLLKLGTGNALAWVLGSENQRGRGVIADLGRLRRAGGNSTLRLIEVDDLLTPFAGAGADALALEHYNRVKDSIRRVPILKKRGVGELSYAISLLGMTAPALLARSKLNVRIINNAQAAERLGDDGQPVGAPIEQGAIVYEGPCNAVFMSTIPYWGFGVRVFPFAADRDDRFSLRVIDIGPVEAIANIRAVWRGTYRHPRLIDFHVSDVRLDFDRATPVEIGGDPGGIRESLTARLHPEPIRVVDYYAPPRVE